MGYTKRRWIIGLCHCNFCLKTFMDGFIGWPMILLIGMGEMLTWLALLILASLAVGNNMV